jgi:hypothetical protein
MASDQKILDINTTLTDSQKLALNIVTMNTAINDLQTDMREINEIVIKGSKGELPLVERIRNMEKYIDNTKYWTRLVASALVLQTLSFGGAVIWAALKLIPLLERLAANAP